jgi:hypothetical protein
MVLLSLTSFSQTDTSNICIPYSTAKLIAIDLVKGDSVLAELKETQHILYITQKKVSTQDSIISTFKLKEIEYKAEITIFESKEILYKESIDSVNTANTKLTKKNKNLKTLSQILGGGLVGVLAALITVVTIK